MKVKSPYKISVLIFISLVLLVNVSFQFINKNTTVSIKKEINSLSRGDSYFSTLKLWYLFASNEEWDKAAFLEKYLNNDDLLVYKTHNNPRYLTELLHKVSQKSADLSVEDWMELSQIYAKLNQTKNANDALLEARRLDPLRVDLEKIEYKIIQN